MKNEGDRTPIGLRPYEGEVETADDEEVDFNERKAQSVLDGKVAEVGPWYEHWSAVEVMSLIKRIRREQAHKCGGNY